MGVGAKDRKNLTARYRGWGGARRPKAFAMSLAPITKPRVRAERIPTVMIHALLSEGQHERAWESTRESPRKCVGEWVRGMCVRESLRGVGWVGIGHVWGSTAQGDRQGVDGMWWAWKACCERSEGNAHGLELRHSRQRRQRLQPVHCAFCAIWRKMRWEIRGSTC
jgi:hypothetical protein